MSLLKRYGYDLPETILTLLAFLVSLILGYRWLHAVGIGLVILMWLGAACVLACVMPAERKS